MTGSPAGFWEATPRMLAIAVEGAMARAKSAHQLVAWLAWTTAALGRVKEMPALNKVLRVDTAARKPSRQTWQEQLAIASAWVARTNA